MSDQPLLTDQEFDELDRFLMSAHCGDETMAMDALNGYRPSRYSARTVASAHLGSDAARCAEVPRCAAVRAHSRAAVARAGRDPRNV